MSKEAPSADERTKARGIGMEIYHCPLCDWTHTEPHRFVDPNALAGVFGYGVMTMVAENEKRERTEQALKQHLGSHTTVQWVTKVNALQREIDALKRSFP